MDRETMPKKPLMPRPPGTNPLLSGDGAEPKPVSAPSLCNADDVLPEHVTEAVEKYIEWCEANPFQQEKVFHSKGVITKTTVSKMRQSTIQGFSLFIGIHPTLWYEWSSGRVRPKIQAAVKAAENAIRVRSVDGAGADMLSGNIVSRVFGLAEKTETTDTTPRAPEVPPETIANLTHPDMTTEQLEALTEAGKTIPLFSQQQLDAGVPFFMP